MRMAEHFAGFRKHMIEPSQVRILAYLHALPDGGAGAPVDRRQSVGGVSSQSAAATAGARLLILCCS